MAGLLGKVVARSARGPVNLAVIGAAVLGAIALGSWPILALGCAAYAALIASDISSPAFRRQVLTGRLPAPGLPRDEAIADAGVRAAAGAVRAGLADVRKAIAATPTRVRRHIQLSVDAIGELERHAAALVERASALSTYLATVDVPRLRAEAEALAERGRQSGDPHARAQYEQAHAAADEQLRAIADLGAARERVLASLSRIAATLHALPAKVMRMRALDDQASDALSGDVTAELDRMNVELKAFEHTLEDLQQLEPS